MDEGVMFGGLAAFIFVAVFAVEYYRAKKSSMKELRREQYVNASTWAIFLFLTASCYVRNPREKDPSIFLTVGAGLNLFAMCLLYIVPRRDGEVNERTVELTGSKEARAPGEFGMLFSLALVIRIFVTMKWNGYLPSDQTGDGCIQLLEFMTVVITAGSTIFREKTLSKQVALRTAAGSFAALMVSCVLYGGLDHNVFADRSYAFCIYLELVAWCFMLHYVLSHHEEYANSLYLLPSGVAAACQMYFWIAVLREHTANIDKAQGWFGYALVGVQLSQCAIFVYMARLTLKNVEALQLPGFVNSESWNVMTRMV